MMYEMIRQMESEINYEIEWCYKFGAEGNEKLHERAYDRIAGMIKMLSIVTGEKYEFDKDGLHIVGE